MKQAVLLVGFGGPQNHDEIRPFLDSVLRGIPIPKERYEEVAHHYEVVGGVSSYNRVTERQRKALEKELQSRKIHVPVLTALRHSRPSMQEAVQKLQERRINRAVAFILAPFRCYSSFEKYKERLEEAKRGEAVNIPVVYTDAFHEEALFIEAQVMKARETLKHLSAEQIHRTFFIFTAHSIPQSMSDPSGYAEQFRNTSRLIARRLKLENWALAYQSRSGSPRDPWLVPDVKDFIATLDRERFDSVFLISPGFLCDNVEVVFDLDIETRGFCAERNLRYFRASTVADNVFFIRLMADQISGKLQCE